MTGIPAIWRSEASPHRFGEPITQAATRLAHMGMSTTGAYTMLGFTADLGPSEPFSISGKQIVGLVPGTCHEHRGVVLQPVEYRRCNKILPGGRMVLTYLGQYHFVALTLQVLRSFTVDTGCALQFSVRRTTLRFRLARPTAGRDGAVPGPYQLRHSGPSHGNATFFRTLAEIKDHARWGSGNIMRRYKKQGRVTQWLPKLLLPARTAAIASPARVAAAFRQPSTAPFPVGALVKSNRRCFSYWPGLPQYLPHTTLDFGNMRLRDCASFGSPMTVGTWLKRMSKKL